MKDKMLPEEILILTFNLALLIFARTNMRTEEVITRIQQPLAICYFNNTMVSVNRFDQNIAKYSTT
jgi:hypothetical protein